MKLRLHNAYHLIFLDDDPVFLLIAQKVCNKLDAVLDSHFFDSASDALTFFKNYRSESQSKQLILFVDINMPKCDGWEFLRRFKSLDQDYKKTCWVYVLSSSTDRIDYQTSNNLEIVRGYIVKPLTVSKLQDLLKVS